LENAGKIIVDPRILWIFDQEKIIVDPRILLGNGKINKDIY
jgi:hypothetical protein